MKNGKAEKVLIIGKKDDFLEAISICLKSEVDKIKTINNQYSNVSMIKEFKPTIILLNVNNLFEKDFELLSKITEFKTKVIIIADDIKVLNHIPINGFDIIRGIFIKPVKIEKIYNVVTYLLSKQN